MRCRRLVFAIVVATGVARAADRLPRIMVVGDSIEAGVNLPRARMQATDRLQRLGNVIVQNFASQGATMASVGVVPGMVEAAPAVRILSGLVGLNGVVVHLGRNDWATDVPLDRFSSAYGTFLDGVPTRARIVCISPTWTTTEGQANANGDTLDDFRAAIQRVCAAHGVPFLDGLRMIPADASYFDGGLHPNARGHRLMATFLLRELARLGWLG